MTARAETAAYRAVLRLCRQVDRQPALAVPLTTSSKAPSHPLAEEAIAQMCGGTTELAHPLGQAAKAARHHRRWLQTLGLPYLPDADELLSRVKTARAIAETASSVSADCAASPKPRRLSEDPTSAQKARTPVQAVDFEAPDGRTGDLPASFWNDEREASPVIAETDPYEGDIDSRHWAHVQKIRLSDTKKSLRGDLDSRGVHSYAAYLRSYGASERAPAVSHIPAADTSPLGVGDILMAHPLASSRPSLDRTGILVTAVDEKANHITGLVLGVPQGYRLRTLVQGRSTHLSDQEELSSVDSLLNLPVMWGGDLRDRRLCDQLSWLHTFGEVVPGAELVAPSLWQGGDISALHELVQSNDGSQRVQPFQGYLGWSISKLVAEVQRGHWIRVRCEDVDVASALCIPPRLRNGDFADAGYHMERTPGHPAIGWAAALRAAGLESLASFPRGGQADKVLQEPLGLKAKFSMTGLEPRPDKELRQNKPITIPPSRQELFGFSAKEKTVLPEGI